MNPRIVTAEGETLKEDARAILLASTYAVEANNCAPEVTLAGRLSVAENDATTLFKPAS
jgi:hypothetical protein